MLRWFGHVERMSERLTKGIYVADVSGYAGRGRPRKTYPDLNNEGYEMKYFLLLR